MRSHRLFSAIGGRSARLPLFLLLLAAGTAHADCARMTTQLFGVEMAGPRTYLSTPPEGLTPFIRQSWGEGGTDSFRGSRHGIEFRALALSWYKDRVVGAVAQIQAGADGGDEVLRTLAQLAGSEFTYWAPGERYQMSCADGASVAASKTQIYGGAGKPPAPIVMLVIQHPSSKQMQAAMQQLRAQGKLRVESSVHRPPPRNSVWLAPAARGTAAPAVARHDSICPRVPSKSERLAQLQGKDSRAMERDGYPADPLVEYRMAMEIGNARDALGAIRRVKGGWPGAGPDLRKADELWRDLWCSHLLPLAEDKPQNAFLNLKAAADLGLLSAMGRLSEAYEKGQFQQPADAAMASTWKEKYEKAKSAKN